MANSATTNNATILTIPANSIWRGSVTLAATLAVSGGGTAQTDYPKVVVSGTGGTWNDADVVVGLALFVPAVGVTAVTGSTATATISTGEIQVQSRTNPLLLKLSFNSTGTSAIGTAIGEFL